VLSIELIPRLEAGQLRLSISRVLAGKLPLPSAFMSRYRQQVENALAAHLPDWRRGAQLGDQGGANLDAVAAAMADLLIDALQDRPAPPVLFLPYSMQSRPKSLPVKVTDMRIEDRTLTMTVQPLDSADRTKLLEQIRSGRESAQAVDQSTR
jgi:hypothetical protein